MNVHAGDHRCQVLAHKICVAAASCCMYLSRAINAFVAALDSSMKDEFKKLQKQLNKKE